MQQRHLTKKIESNYFILEANDAVRELVWDLLRKIYNPSVAKTGEININEILHFIEGIQDFNGIQVWNWEIKIIKCHLMELLENGVNTISEPWPSEDQTMSSGFGLGSLWIAGSCSQNAFNEAFKERFAPFSHVMHEFKKAQI